jgi:hypothetical protein
MDPKKIVHHPVHPSQPLPSRGCFGIHIGLPSKGRTCSAQGTPERFGMIGMDIRLGNGTRCRKMFSPWTLILGALTTFFMCLCTFMLQPDVHTSFERLLGSSSFAIVHECMAYRKEQMAIAAFTIGTDAQIVRLSRNLVQCLYCLCQESSILLATVSLPDASTGSVHEQYGPPR